MPYRPKLDPRVDLAGATPEILGRSLFRRGEPLRPSAGGQPVVGDETTVAGGASYEPGDDIAYLVESV